MLIHKPLKIILAVLVTIIGLYLCTGLTFADEGGLPKIEKLTLGNWGTYPAADIWMTFGADFENVSDDGKTLFFLVDSQGKTEDSAIILGEECSVQAVPKSDRMVIILGEKQDYGFLIHNLEPGQYYIGCKLSDNGNVDYKYAPFNVYPCAKDYAKEALDRVINSYIREPDGWYWEDGKYIGLGYKTDVYGNSWESWMFPALGAHYTMNDGTVLNFSKDGHVLSSYDGRWFMDMASEGVISGTQTNLWKIGSTEVSKHMLAFCAYGEDPRDINNLDIVKTGIQYLYERDGTLPYDENGDCVVDGKDMIPYSYMLLAMEASGATPKEGYTRLIRDSLFKAMWVNTLTDISIDDYIISSPDSFAMAKLALPLFRKYPECADKIDGMISNMNAVIDNNIYANGAMQYSNETGNNEKYGCPNADSLAVVINALVIGGLRIEDFDQGIYTKQYGSILTSLGSCIVEDGVVYGDKANRMATYQTLGALVDLYNNRSCFEVAYDTFRGTHPEYLEDDYGKLSIISVSGIKDQTFTGKPILPEIQVIGELPTITPMQAVYGTVLPTERNLEEGLDYTVKYKNNTQPGKATVTVTGIGDYYGTKEVTFNIVKNEKPTVVKKVQPMTVKTVTKKVSYKKLKKKKQIVKKALVVKKNQGKVTYKKLKGSSGKLTINAKNGNITVKKKTKKGTYKIKVKVTAAGNAKYKAGSKTVTVKIKVK